MEKEKKNETLHMRVKPSQKERWANEAARQSKTLSQWVCDKLDEEARYEQKQRQQKLASK